MSNAVYSILSRYTQPPLIIFGTIGAIFNQILFSSRKSLRSNSCSFYFRALSINDLLVMYVYVLLQWIADQYGFDLSKTCISMCKIKTYINCILYTLSPYFVVLACFDRLCTSSRDANLRRIATPRIASYLTFSMIVIVIAAYSHIPIYTTLFLGPTGLTCSSTNLMYSKINAIFVLTFLAILPPILMTICCITTLILLRIQRRRVMPINQARIRQRDAQIFKMLLLYVAFHLICTIPFSVVLLIAVYQLPAPSATISTLYQSFVLLFNASFSISFYIYTLSTPFYRHEFLSLTMNIFKRCRRIIKPN
ncbi:unnamed protein product [Adineta ricciae]|uniref:G-protein coupled receptors family 1 profile domain-containing protein n=1 Tax=Adineta ricciae TaxID=249248 RepID=A0A814HLW3_ADIRI|nr:unnamed protein product [Adineta ricciae]CAF1012907.1 unnamed protein product [Adineta ricciae]